MIIKNNIKFQLAALTVFVLACCHYANSQTIADRIVQSPEHSILTAAVLAAPPTILTTLNSTTPGSSYTVFAPDDGAFEDDFPAQFLEDIVTPAWTGHLVCLLTAHVVPGTYRLADWPTTNATELPTLNAGYNVSIVRRDDEALVDNVAVTTADLNGTNGVVHVISERPITPPCIAQSIVEIASSRDDLTTLVSLLEATRLVDTLGGEIGPYTVFAPTDTAFAKLPPGTVDALRNDERTLAELLLYHVIDGNAYSSFLATLMGSTNLTTLNSGNITVSASGGAVIVNTATVTLADVLAGNGVIHVIDTVLLPTDFDDPRGSNVDVVFASPDHGILREAIRSVDGLIESLETIESYTLFAPTDTAFEETVPEDLVEMLFRPEWSRHLACVLQEHVIIGPAVLSSAITNGLTATTANNSTIAFAVTTNGGNDTVVTVDNITISAPDLVTADGVVHVIDGVILPDCVSKSIYDVASSAADFSTLKSLVDLVPELNETLSSTRGRGLTLFAPTNAAFAKLDAALVANLQSNVTALTEVLTYHVLDDVRDLEGDLLEQGTVETVEGSTLAFALNAANISTVNGIAIAEKEVLASNGVIYVIDTILSTSQTLAPVAAPVTIAPVVATMPTTAPVMPTTTAPASSNATVPTIKPVTTGAPIMPFAPSPVAATGVAPTASASAASRGSIALCSILVAVLAVTAVTLGLLSL